MRLLLVVALVLSGVVVPRQRTFLLLGDSITQGGADHYPISKPWRSWLNEIRLPGQEIYRYVGLLPGYNGKDGHGMCWDPTKFDEPHGAQCGQKSEDILEWLRASTDYVSQKQVTDVVVATGTNNIGSNQSVKEAIRNTEDLIEEVEKKWPRANVYVATLIWSAGYLVADYNDSLRHAVTARQLNGERIYLLDWSSVITEPDTYDGLHPNADGSRKMATFARKVFSEQSARILIPDMLLLD